MRLTEKSIYVAPAIESVELVQESVICISGTRGDYGAANEEEWD